MMASLDDKKSTLVTSAEEKSTGPANHMATIRDDDERLLAQIGYTQVSRFILYSVIN